MDPVQILKYITAISSVIIVGSVLVQVGSGGLGTIFGGSAAGEVNRTRRGTELLMYRTTIVAGIVFAISALFVSILSA